MTSQLGDLPCLARLKAMDLRSGQHYQIRWLPCHAIAKLPGTSKILEVQRQAPLNTLMAGSTCF